MPETDASDGGQTTQEHATTEASPATTRPERERQASPKRNERQKSQTPVPPTTAPPQRKRPVVFTVTEVIDGDTITVRPLRQSQSFRVRLIGIDAPESGSCTADAATWTLTSVVQGQRVNLRRGGDGENTDRYGRFLRYVDVNGVDAGLRLIEDGLAIARYDSRDGYGAHRREADYIAADEATPPYMCPPRTTQPPPPTTQAPQPPPPLPAVAVPQPPDNGGCDPNYTGCVPIASDVDCAGGSGNGPAYVYGPVQVIGNDVYGLDGNDNDGIGCE